MRIAITGGTGFVGGHLARLLAIDGHHVVLIARGLDGRDDEIRRLPNATFHAVGTGDEDQLAAAFAGCDAVAHCAGINRELGMQTYARVHRHGTRHVVDAARRAGVRKIALVSFLRARPTPALGLSRIEVRGRGNRARLGPRLHRLQARRHLRPRRSHARSSKSRTSHLSDLRIRPAVARV